jgi:PAS domain S-box-containing protein
MGNRKTGTDIHGIAKAIHRHEDEIRTEWLAALRKAWGRDADGKVALLHGGKRRRSDLLALLNISIADGADLRGLAVPPVLARVRQAGFSAGDFLLECECLLESIEGVLRRVADVDALHLLDGLGRARKHLWRVQDKVMQETSEVFERIVESGARAFCRMDSTGTILHANQEMERLLGSRLAGRRFDAFFRGEDQAFVRKALSRRSAGAPRVRPLQCVLASGQRVPVGVEIGPLRFGRENRGGYACMVNLSHPARIERDIMDRSPFGVLRLDLHLRLTYANPKGLEILGMDTWEGRTIRDVVPDAKNFQIIRRQLARRRRGLVDEYQVEITRFTDKERIPVMISAMPETDLQGQVVGVRAQVRSLVLQKATEAIHTCLATPCSCQEMLRAVAVAMGKVVPFDLFAVSVYSKDGTFVRPMLIHPSDKFTPRKRWWKMTEPIRKWVARQDIFTTGNLRAFLGQPELQSVRGERDVQELLSEGFRSVMRYPVRDAEGKTLATVSLMSKSKDAYGEDQKALLRTLPLDKTVMLALYDEQKEEMEFRVGLMQEMVTSCDSVPKAVDAILQSLSKHYAWQNVAIFRVDDESRSLRMMSQAGVSGTAFPVQPEQSWDEGILGHVYRTGKAVNVGNVRTHQEFKGIYKEDLPGTVSELCLPIRTHGRISWLLNVEDSRENAFSDDEVNALEALLEEVGILLQRAWFQHFLQGTLQSTSDAVIVTGKSGTIREANPAAHQLLGLDEGKAKGRGFEDFFAERIESEGFLEAGRFTSTEVALRREDGSEMAVLLSGATLPEPFSGRVFTAKDLSMHKRVEELQYLERMYREIAVQTKTPLSLVFSWLRRAKEGCGAGPLADTLDKVLAQLRKVELTYDRLALYNRDTGSLLYNELFLNFSEILDKVMRGFPQAERQKIQVEMDQPLIYVRGDLDQLSFCVETILSYLLRFAPEARAVSMKVIAPSDRVIVEISGFAPASTEEHAFRTLTEMALGEGILKAFIHRHGGSYDHMKDGEAIHFRIELPVARG